MNNLIAKYGQAKSENSTSTLHVFNKLCFFLSRYLNYGEDQWRKEVEEHLSSINLYHDEVRRNFEATLGWLKEHACSRSYGLGKSLVLYFPFEF